MSPNLVRLATLALSGLIAVAIGHAASRLTRSLSGETGVALPDIAVSVEQAPPAALDLTPIFVLAPFGSPVVESAPEAVVAEETSSGLVLRGIVTAAPSGNSVAVIATEDGEARLYSVGDVIDGKATLVEVLPDRAMLQVGDRVETLSYPKLSSTRGDDDIIAEPNEGEDFAEIPVEDGAVRPGKSGSAGATASIEPASMVEEMRSRIMDNPQSFMDSMGISVVEGGYAIAENAPPSLLSTGLRPGDMIAKVNGRPVGDIEDDRQLLDEVIASGKVRVEVIRDGRNVVMSFPLQ